jgi:hypothetical protein
MPTSVASARDPNLLGITMWRSLVLGRTFLLVGMGYTIVFALILGITSGASFNSAYPLILPIFSVVGAMGALMVFTNDRIKGVLEYLLAYGISPRRVFVNVLIAGLAITTILLGVSLGVGVGVRYASGQGVSIEFAQLVLVYALPMSYASVAFAATIGMYWTSLSSPRSGIGSPVGLIPFVGIGPPVATLVLVGYLLATTSVPFLLVAGSAEALVVFFVVVLLTQIRRLMPLERLLSPT